MSDRDLLLAFIRATIRACEFFVALVKRELKTRGIDQ